MLDPKGESIQVMIDKHAKFPEFDGYMKFHGIHQWVKGMNLDEEQNFMCCWTTKTIYLYDFDPKHVDMSYSK